MLLVRVVVVGAAHVVSGTETVEQGILLQQRHRPPWERPVATIVLHRRCRVLQLPRPLGRASLVRF